MKYSAASTTGLARSRVGALEQILGASGVGLVILGVVYLLAANRHDRKQAVDEIAAARNRTEAAQKREDELRAELQAKLDAERDRRRAAEDRRDEQADQFEEQARQWRAEIERLTAEIKKLRETVT